MAENRLPRALNKLLAHADLQIAACRKWQDVLELCRVRADDLEPAVTDARAAEAQLRAAHVAWSEARTKRHRIDHESWDFITLTRLSLAAQLGERWSARWAVIGFTRRTLRVPEQFAARAYVLTFLTMAFASHPEWELTDAGFTLASATAARDALTAANARYQDAGTRLHTARQNRTAAVATLNEALRRLRKELHVALKPADPLWLAFDLNQPIRTPRKRQAQTSVVPANDSPEPGTAGVSPASSFVDTRRQDAGGPGAGPDSDACEAPADFVRVSPAFATAALRAPNPHHTEEHEEEFTTTTRGVPPASQRSWWNLLRAGASKITWNLF